MGHHASASLYYGYCFYKYTDEYDQLPWETEDDYYSDMEDWYYQDIIGFKSKSEIYDDNGRLPHITQEEALNYWEDYYKFKRKQNIVIKFIECKNIGIIYLKQPIYENTIGEFIFINNLSVNSTDSLIFEIFCTRYLNEIINNKQLGWYLITTYE